MPPSERAALWELVASSGELTSRFIADAQQRMGLATLAEDAAGRAATSALWNKNVLLYTSEQLGTARALASLDGVARRLIICPSALSPEHLASVVHSAEVDAVVADGPIAETAAATIGFLPFCRPEELAPVNRPADRIGTEWVLFTSGTTGSPKLVVHTLETLVGSLSQVRLLGAGSVWSTFYDIRRYGGLQILLRALVAGGSMVLSASSETPSTFLQRLSSERVSHISGTPSHWRRALMSGATNLIGPRYVRMSGEVADQAIIDALRAAYPNSLVAHAFASTEAGLAFEVDDGRAGFPARFVDTGTGAAVLRVEHGSLRVRSTRVAHRYVGKGMPPLAHDDGFVDTGDMVELRGDRYYFVGRREGIINIGGLKVHPEEVEVVINQHPMVQMSLVRSRRNPITGAIVVADVVPRSPEMLLTGLGRDPGSRLTGEILQFCRDRLEPYKVPATIRLVETLNIGISGKLVRHHA